MVKKHSVEKKTNADIDLSLSNRDVIRLDNYLGAHVKINWQCKICNYTWLTTPSSVVNLKTGCKKCAGLLLLNNETVDKRLIGRNITRTSNYIGTRSYMEFSCDICNYIWGTSPGSVFSGAGCAQCAGKIPLTNKIVDQRLIGRQIKRLDDITGCATRINWQCIVEGCNYVWRTSPNKIVNDRKQGCPKCAKNAKYTNESVDKICFNKKIKRLDDIIDSKIKIRFECLNDNCGYIWKTAPIVVVNIGCGCPKCSAGKNEQIVYKLLKNNNINFIYQKHIQELNETNDNLIGDFYLPEFNIIIEYNGIQHYRPTRFNGINISIAKDNFEKQKIRDKLLQLFCDQNNINLIWIDGTKYFNNKLEKYMLNTIIPYVQNNIEKRLNFKVLDPAAKISNLKRR